MTQVVSEAVNAFRRGAYVLAESIFGECQKTYGDSLFSENISMIRKRIIRKFTTRSVPPPIDPVVYYCVPVMNRLSDIQATLGHNLSVVKCFSNVKIIINLFDDTDESFNWIAENFESEMSSDLLQVNRLPPLEFWHFSWAKNSFKTFIGDEGVYSSLDGDNYITQEEVARTKQIYSEFNAAVIHHFTGNWGDGSSGRVSVLAEHYKRYGYRDELFPRQFDEMSLMMNILRLEPNADFFCREEADIFSKSWFLRLFQDKENWRPSKRFVALGNSKAPENPKGHGYVQRDEKLEIYTRINANLSLLKVAQTKEAQSFFTESLNAAKDHVFTLEASTEIANMAVIPWVKGLYPELSAETTLYSVVKNDAIFLRSWIDHYRSIGVERFIIVDDGSDQPLADAMLGDDVFVFKPVVGDFKNFKVFWLMCLMKRFQQTGSVCVCADADEYIDIPDSGSADMSKIESLKRTNLSLKKYGRVPGILLDLMPENHSIKVTYDNYLETMTHHSYVDAITEGVEAYRNHPSICWAFSKFWRKSFKYDLRYHVYGTVDCLRKFPIFIYEDSLKLNQGFHDLVKSGSGAVLESDDFLLPIRHYKMLKLLLDDEKPANDDFSSYFGRTAENLTKIYGSGKYHLLRAWKQLEKIPFENKYIELRS